MYYPIFLAIFLSLACPSSSHHAGPRHGSGGGIITAQDTTGSGIGGSGGDEGHLPPHHP